MHAGLNDTKTVYFTHLNIFYVHIYFKLNILLFASVMNYSPGLVKMKDNYNEFIENKTKQTPIAMVAPELKQNEDTGITKTCAVLGCDDPKNVDADSFFSFPEDVSLRQIWTDLTGRNNWTPTDFSYICSQHFSIDCFSCDEQGNIVLCEKAVPSLKLPRHVLEVEYIEDETFENEDYDEEMESDEERNQLVNGNLEHNFTNLEPSSSKEIDLDLLKLYTEVQRMQRQVVSLRDKLKFNMKVHNKQNRFLKRLRDVIETKRKILNEKRKKKARILLSLQDKIKEDTNGLVLAMPTRYTDDLKNFALSIYKYSPQAYIYLRNTLRTMLPSTEIMDNWLSTGYQPKNIMANNNLVKISAEQSETEMTCKITIC